MRREYLEVIKSSTLYLLFIYIAFSVVFSYLEVGLLNITLFGVLLSFLLFLVSFFGEKTFQGVDFSLDRRSVGVFLVLFVVWGLFLRIYRVGVQSFWFDEAISTNAALGFLSHGVPMFPSGFVYWRSFPHVFVMSGFLEFFGGSEFFARLPSVFLGSIGIYLIYLLGKEVGDWEVGLVASFAGAFCTWQIAWGRQARMYQMLQVLYVLGVFLIYKVEENDFKDIRYGLALVLVLFLAPLTHKEGYLLFPVAVTYFVFSFVRRGDLSYKRGVLFGLVVLFAVLGLEAFSSGITGVVNYTFGGEADFLGSFLSWSRQTLEGIYLFGLVGAGFSFYRKDNYKGGFLLLVSFLPALLVLGGFAPHFSSRLLLFVAPVLFIWFGYAVTGIRDILAKKMNLDSSLSSMALVVFLVALVVFGGGFTLLPKTEYELGTNAPQPDFKGAYGFVSEEMRDGDVVVCGWTAPGLYYLDRAPEYSLPSPGRGVHEGVEHYSGAELLYNATDLQEVVEEHERGWVVLDGHAWRMQTTETRIYLTNNLNKHEVDAKEMHVFSWN